MDIKVKIQEYTARFNQFAGKKVKVSFGKISFIETFKECRQGKITKLHNAPAKRQKDGENKSPLVMQLVFVGGEGELTLDVVAEDIDYVKHTGLDTITMKVGRVKYEFALV